MNRRTRATFGKLTVAGPPRRDNDDDFRPENCRFTTRARRRRNIRSMRLLTLNGVTRQLTEWSRVLAIPRNVLTTPYEPGCRAANKARGEGSKRSGRKPAADLSDADVAAMIALRTVGGLTLESLAEAFIVPVSRVHGILRKCGVS